MKKPLALVRLRLEPVAADRLVAEQEALRPPGRVIYCVTPDRVIRADITGDAPAVVADLEIPGRLVSE
jgi:hypothetical protein